MDYTYEPDEVFLGCPDCHSPESIVEDQSVLCDQDVTIRVLPDGTTEEEYGDTQTWWESTEVKGYHCTECHLDPRPEGDLVRVEWIDGEWRLA